MTPQQGSRAQDGNGPPEQRLTEHTLVAVYEELEPAKAAIERLRRDGWQPGEYSLVGRGQELQPGGERPVEAPAQGGSGLGRAAVRGLGSGVAIGAAVGALVGAILHPVLDFGTAWPVTALLFAALGGFIGQVPGLMLSWEWFGRRSLAWQQTLSPIDTAVNQGKVVVAVHTNEPSRIEQAERLLEPTRPTEVHHLDASQSLEPGRDERLLTGTEHPSGHPERHGP